jgi:hypothetical protein
MPTLDKEGGGKLIEKSKILRISLPRSNPNIKSDIDAQLDNGWHIQTSMYLQDDNDLLIIFTKPKRNE